MKGKFDELSAKCSKITTKLYSTSFSLGIHYLHKELRSPIYAIYGFVRLADEIVDSFHNYDKVSLLTEFRRDCFLAIERGISLNPVLNSFQQVVNQYGIEHDLIDQFLLSMEMDLSPQSYSAEKYETYILGSAQVVGLMCLQVFVKGDPILYNELKTSAMKLGSAFQKVNFLRDAGADYFELSRNYFPEIDLASFTDRDKQYIEADICNDFSDALDGIRCLPRSSKKGVYLAYVYYQKLFNKICKVKAEEVMASRIRVSNSHKFWLMFDSMVRYKVGVI